MSTKSRPRSKAPHKGLSVSEAAPPKTATRVMIVDDHPLLRDGLKQLINIEKDMKVCAEAANARDAMALLKQDKPDILLVDLTLEDIGGLELIKQIKETYGELPILVLSMHNEALYAERALRAGARGYVMKREGTDKLIHAIRTILRGEVFVSDKMASRMLGKFVGGNPDTLRSLQDRLSDRELEVFELIGQGLSTRQIAQRLFVSIKTVESHREHIKTKLNLNNATELVQHATQWVMTEESDKNE